MLTECAYENSKEQRGPCVSGDMQSTAQQEVKRERERERQRQTGTEREIGVLSEFRSCVKVEVAVLGSLS